MGYFQIQKMLNKLWVGFCPFLSKLWILFPGNDVLCQYWHANATCGGQRSLYSLKINYILNYLKLINDVLLKK